MKKKHFKKKNENKIVSVLLSLSSLLYSYLTFLMNSFTVIGGIWIWQSHGCFLFLPLVSFPSSLCLLLLLIFSSSFSFSSSFLLLFLLLFLHVGWYFRIMDYLGLIMLMIKGTAGMCLTEKIPFISFAFSWPIVKSIHP